MARVRPPHGAAGAGPDAAGIARWVRLNSDDPGGPPKVEFNFLDDERDLVRLMAGFRLATEIFAAPELAAVCGGAFVLENASGLMRFNQLSRRNAARGRLAAACLDLAPGIARSLLRRFAGMRSVAGLGDDDDLAEHIRANIMGTYHVCGTCRIGPASDPTAVVDAAGGVHGISGLRIGDASVMPSVPSGNTHLPTVMVAEKISDAMRWSK
jgi:5-(hydroxymethyl)furfural/furfural oxidase